MKSRKLREAYRPRSRRGHIRKTPDDVRRGRLSAGFMTSVMAIAAIAMLVLSCGDGAVEPASPPAPVATTVTINPVSATLTALGETARLTAEVRDQNGQVMAGAQVNWTTSESGIASVSATGLVTAVANGSADVTASVGSASASARITVEQRVSRVRVSPPDAVLASLGDTVRLSAEGQDANGNPVAGVDFTWSSDDRSVAIVDTDGLVTAVANGSAKVTASSERSSAMASVTVSDVGAFLKENSHIATAMVWLGTDNRPKPYAGWPQAMKDKLVLAIKQLRGDGTGLPEVAINQAADLLADDAWPVTVFSKEDAEDLYVANIAHSLILEMDGTLPWSLDDLSDRELEMVLGWRSFFLAHTSDDSRYWAAPAGVSGYVMFIRASPAPPEVIREFIADNDLVGRSRYETIIRTIDWARYHLTHFCGGTTAQNYEDHWDYRGAPPLARMFVKTTREGNPDCPRRGTGHYTAGCGGTTWFLIHVLRAVNIPVEDMDMPDSGHATPGFPSEGLYLSHGDDPYMRSGWHSPPFPEPYPSNEIPISEAQYTEWFNESNSREENQNNVGRKATELMVEHLTQWLLHLRCEDRSDGTPKESSRVYRPGSTGIGRYWTVADLDAMSFWERMDAKIAQYGGCPIPHPTRPG